MRRRRRGGHGAGAVGEINVTSLLDIVFVLLIAFMIVAPALKHGVNLELPKVEKAPSYKVAQKPVAVRVGWNTATEQPEALVDNKSVNISDLAQVVRLTQEKGAGAVTLEADRRVPWETMAGIVSNLQLAGVEKVGLITTPKKN